ncbi:uncharacterized protein VTP21DRAFT_186 [Calcarisporiella thermophila]|uniref:uncharacterized protein n=1 Tax=Calcarisporiella thermophila TaxID=911321 RepID=UPI0037420B69
MYNYSSDFFRSNSSRQLRENSRKNRISDVNGHFRFDSSSTVVEYDNYENEHSILSPHAPNHAVPEQNNDDCYLASPSASVSTSFDHLPLEYQQQQQSQIEYLRVPGVDTQMWLKNSEFSEADLTTTMEPHSSRSRSAGSQATRRRIGTAGRGFGSLINDDTSNIPEDSVEDLLQGITNKDVLRLTQMTRNHTDNESSKEKFSHQLIPDDESLEIERYLNHDEHAHYRQKLHPSPTTLERSEQCKQYLKIRYNIISTLLRSGESYNPLAIIRYREEYNERMRSINKKPVHRLPNNSRAKTWQLDNSDLLKYSRIANRTDLQLTKEEEKDGEEDSASDDPGRPTSSLRVVAPSSSSSFEEIAYRGESSYSGSQSSVTYPSQISGSHTNVGLKKPRDNFHVLEQKPPRSSNTHTQSAHHGSMHSKSSSLGTIPDAGRSSLDDSDRYYNRSSLEHHLDGKKRKSWSLSLFRKHKGKKREENGRDRSASLDALHQPRLAYGSVPDVTSEQSQRYRSMLQEIGTLPLPDIPEASTKLKKATQHYSHRNEANPPKFAVSSMTSLPDTSFSYQSPDLSCGAMKYPHANIHSKSSPRQIPITGRWQEEFEVDELEEVRERSDLPLDISELEDTRDAMNYLIGSKLSLDVGGSYSKHHNTSEVDLERTRISLDTENDNNVEQKSDIEERHDIRETPHEEESHRTIVLDMDRLPPKLRTVIEQFKTKGIMLEHSREGDVVVFDLADGEGIAFEKMIECDGELINLHVTLVGDPEKNSSGKYQEMESTISNSTNIHIEARDFAKLHEHLLDLSQERIHNLQLEEYNKPIHYSPALNGFVNAQLGVELGVNLIRDDMAQYDEILGDLDGLNRRIGAQMRSINEEIKEISAVINERYFHILKGLEDEVQVINAMLAKNPWLDIGYIILEYLMAGIALLFWFIVLVVRAAKRKGVQLLQVSRHFSAIIVESLREAVERR